MVKRLNERDPAVVFVEYRKYTNVEELLECDLSDFVSCKTKVFLNKFELQSDFLKLDPSIWETNEQYAAERGVKFMKDYNRMLTRDEEQLQFILQVVDSYRKKYPSHTKSALTERS